MIILTLLDTANSLAPSSPTVPTSVGVGIVCAYLVHFVKKLRQVPRINFYSTRLNAAIRAVTSFVSTLGVSFTWSHDTHTLIIANLSLAVIVTSLFHWVQQYGIQHGFEAAFQVMQTSTNRAQQEGVSPKVPTT